MNQKFVFLYALVAAFIIFNIGIFLGYGLEASRINKINQMYLETDMALLDQRIQSEAGGIVEFSCTDLMAENIKFGDKIFQDAQQILKYEEANRINDEIKLQHKKYDLLRTMFWVNAMKIREKCNSDVHRVVYLYKYNNPLVIQLSEQKFFSNLLSELKEKYGNEILLIPIAGDNDIVSLNLLMKEYGVTELPSILINEETVITEIESMEDIEKYLN